MKVKFYLLLLGFLITNNYFAGPATVYGTWRGDLKVNGEVYKCDGKKEFIKNEFGSMRYNHDYHSYICLDPKDKNQASWIVHSFMTASLNEEKVGKEDEYEGESGLSYNEKCQFTENEESKGWKCEKEKELKFNGFNSDEVETDYEFVADFEKEAELENRLHFLK